MNKIKFRQPLNQGKHKYHYWGFIGDSFVHPIRIDSAEGDSMQFIGIYDVTGSEIYDGDLVRCENGYLGSIWWNEENLCWYVGYLSATDRPRGNNSEKLTKTSKLIKVSGG